MYYRRVAALLTLMLAGLTGCSSILPARSLQVAVRDGETGHPVAGAVVKIRSVHLHLPSYPYPKMDLQSQYSDEAITDGEGVVRLSASPNQPLQVIVSLMGHSPLSVYLLEHPAIRGIASPWIGDELAGHYDPARSTLEIQFRPVVKR